MIQTRKRDDIFFIDGGWFQGYWHFSFDRYHDPQNTNFGALRVFNVDTLVPGGVWPMHPHRDIEVITYCVDGQFKHADNLGNGGILMPGDVQHTTVGRGLSHSEINNSETEPMTFIQIWILPNDRGLEPSLEQRRIRAEERIDRLLPIVSSRHPDALPIRQEAEVYAATIQSGVKLAHGFPAGWGGYLHLVSGELNLSGHRLSPGDAAKITEEPEIELEALEESHLLMVSVVV